MENQNSGPVCRHCGARLPRDARVCPECGKRTKGIIRRFWWAWIVIAILVLSSIGSASAAELPEEAPTAVTLAE